MRWDCAPDGAAMADHDTLRGWGDRAKVAWFVDNAETVIPHRQ
jgi:hypothetical protein